MKFLYGVLMIIVIFAFSGHMPIPASGSGNCEVCTNPNSDAVHTLTHYYAYYCSSGDHTWYRVSGYTYDWTGGCDQAIWDAGNRICAIHRACPVCDRMASETTHYTYVYQSYRCEADPNKSYDDHTWHKYLWTNGPHEIECSNFYFSPMERRCSVHDD